MRGGLEHPGLEHPRTILAVRVLLYLGLVIVLSTLAVGVVGYLFVVAAFGGVALLAGTGPSAVALLALVLGGVVIAALVGVGSVVGVQWAERRVVAADRRPDPVEELTDRYVAAELDEIEFERRLEAVLANRSRADEIDSPQRTAASQHGNSALSIEENHSRDGTDR